jgi:hypothetical protein
MSQMLIPSLRNSHSRSLFCASKIFAHSRTYHAPKSIDMSVQQTIAHHPSLVLIISLHRLTPVLIVSLHRPTRVLLVIFAISTTLNEFVDAGVILLKTVNIWQCISLLQIICRKTPIWHPLARFWNAGTSLTNSTLGLLALRYVPSWIWCLLIWQIALMIRLWRRCITKMMPF